MRTITGRLLLKNVKVASHNKCHKRQQLCLHYTSPGARSHSVHSLLQPNTDIFSRRRSQTHHKLQSPSLHISLKASESYPIIFLRRP
ncbi:hypothetical protein RRG08_047117 [Elysia crispata]|uniref:Uncharacterized protein n=1 Tax=Elysia crispata TaxID=231223 RepID=A0AAE1ANX0_9GAST|nr:hypothetical protein RRG08_047117 [Elysia crispata]